MPLRRKKQEVSAVFPLSAPLPAAFNVVAAPSFPVAPVGLILFVAPPMRRGKAGVFSPSADMKEETLLLRGRTAPHVPFFAKQ